MPARTPSSRASASAATRRCAEQTPVPLRLRRPSLLRPLLEALRPSAGPEDHLHLVVERDRATVDTVLAAGGTLTFTLMQMAAAIEGIDGFDGIEGTGGDTGGAEPRGQQARVDINAIDARSR